MHSMFQHSFMAGCEYSYRIAICRHFSVLQKVIDVSSAHREDSRASSSLDSNLETKWFAYDLWTIDCCIRFGGLFCLTYENALISLLLYSSSSSSSLFRSYSYCCMPHAFFSCIHLLACSRVQMLKYRSVEARLNWIQFIVLHFFSPLESIQKFKPSVSVKIFKYF